MEHRPETNPPSAVNPAGLDRNSEPCIGGADAVEKTTYVSDVHGAEADGEAVFPVPITAAVPREHGLGLMGWAAVALAVLAFVAYAAGLFG